MKTIDLFVSKFNSLLEYRKDKGFCMGESIKPLKEKDSHEGIDYFIKGFEHKKVVGFSWFSLWKPGYQIPSNLIWIASYPNINLEYVLDQETKEIALYDPVYESIEWCGAVDYQAFFKSLLIVIDVEMEIERTRDYDLDQSFLLEKYLLCMELNNNEKKYSEFYEHILGVEISE